MGAMASSITESVYEQNHSRPQTFSTSAAKYLARTRARRERVVVERGERALSLRGSAVMSGRHKSVALSVAQCWYGTMTCNTLCWHATKR
jgi:hypothetical protein